METTYYKCLVIELDPFCESRVVFDNNYNVKEHDEIIKQIDSKYFDKEQYLIILSKQKLYIVK